MDLKFLIVFATIFCGFVEMKKGANVLVIIPHPARSHIISFEPLWEELIKKGYNLTVIAAYALNDKFQSNYTLVNIKPVFKKKGNDPAALRKQNSLHNMILLYNLCQEHIEDLLGYPDVQKIINSRTKYDLVIAQMAYTDAFFAFGYKFNAPVIAFTPTTLFSSYNWILGTPFPSSHVSDLFLGFTEKMSLFDRIVNTMYTFITVLFYEFVILPDAQTQIEKYFHFDKENTPHIKDIMKNISVTFANSHYSFGYAKPHLPNVVNIAGLHLTFPAPLAKDMLKFLDEAEHGFIYVSLGSLIGPDKIENLGRTFVNVMENLPQRVVMKWDSSLLPYIPKNFIVRNWLSQEAVLNHRKCRLFISHGGLHSILESLNASVPLIGIPFFGDQTYNMAIVDYYEIGITLQVEDVFKELSSKIKQVLQNPKYKNNMIKRSLIFRNRQENPLETAMYWVDHILKHKDTDHLRSAVTQLAWYEHYSLDVLVVLTVIICVLLKTVWVIIRKIKQKLTSITNKLFTKY